VLTKRYYRPTFILEEQKPMERNYRTVIDGGNCFSTFSTVLVTSAYSKRKVMIVMQVAKICKMSTIDDKSSS